MEGRFFLFYGLGEFDVVEKMMRQILLARFDASAFKDSQVWSEKRIQTSGIARPQDPIESSGNTNCTDRVGGSTCWTSRYASGLSLQKHGERGDRPDQ